MAHSLQCPLLYHWEVTAPHVLLIFVLYYSIPFVVKLVVDSAGIEPPTRDYPEGSFRFASQTADSPCSAYVPGSAATGVCNAAASGTSPCGAYGDVYICAKEESGSHPRTVVVGVTGDKVLREMPMMHAVQVQLTPPRFLSRTLALLE